MLAKNMHKSDKKDEEEGCGNIYINPDKSVVLQETRRFNESNLNSRSCVQTLTKLLVVLGQGHKVGKNEATDAFFAMTKLFQTKDQNVRRMLYLVIKELAGIANDVIIVTSSLIKDMTGPEVNLRGPAIRALCSIMEPSMVQSVERYLKQAIVDKSPAISSAVLTSAFKLYKDCPDVIKRWSNEVQEAASSSRVMVQYHAFGLLCAIRRSDPLTLSKMLQNFMRSTIKSPYACCLMIRIVSKKLDEEGQSNNAALLTFLESSLRHKSEMVIYEAARAIVHLRWAGAKELAPAVSVLQLLCSSHKSALRYAAVRTLNGVATTYPAAVTACNLELEQLISDQNRSIATLAITTLLKTGNDSNVERLLKQVSPFMKDITDEFKIVVLESIRSLAIKYPKKYLVLLNFLSGLLRESAGYTFKKAVVLVMESIIKTVPEAKCVGLLQLCEFIEDCEHVKLTQRILYLLGREGPFLDQPRQFTRFIYNRIVLEAAPVKCSATTALARFAAYNKDMLPSILVLLKRIMLDEDDEVRDRAGFYHHILSLEGDAGKELQLSYLLGDEMQLSAPSLERQLLDYVRNPTGDQFDLASVPSAAAVDKVKPVAESAAKAKSSTTGPVAPAAAPGKESTKLFVRYADKLAAIPKLAKLGPLFKSSQPELVTEEDTEYIVSCVKHVFAKHLVLQFDCTNTLPDQVLDDVYVELEPDEDSASFEILDTLRCPSLGIEATESVYSLIRLPDELDALSATWTALLKFRIRDVADSSDSGLSDEYQLEDVNLTVADHMQGMTKSNFSLAWQDFEPDSEAEETYVLGKCKTIKSAVSQIVGHMGLQPCEQSDNLTTSATSKSSHTLLLAGTFRVKSCPVLVRCQLVLGQPPATPAGVSVLLTVRSQLPEVSQLVADTLA